MRYLEYLEIRQKSWKYLEICQKSWKVLEFEEKSWKVPGKSTDYEKNPVLFSRSCGCLQFIGTSFLLTAKFFAS